MGVNFRRLNGVMVALELMFWFMWLNACRIGECELMFVGSVEVVFLGPKVSSALDTRTHF